LFYSPFIDDFVKSKKCSLYVIPAEAGIQSFHALIKPLDPGWNLPASVCGGFISLLPAFGWLAGRGDDLFRGHLY